MNVLVGNIDTLVSMCHNFSGKIRLYAGLFSYLVIKFSYLVLCTFSEKSFNTVIDGMDFVYNNNIKKKRTQVSCVLGERIWTI